MTAVDEVASSPATVEAPRAPVEIRSSAIASVNWAQRVIEFIAVPYDEEAVVMWRGEPWREVFLRGAWDGIEKRPNRVKANRDHDKTRTVGKIVNFWPSRQEGLVGAAKIAQTPLGDETLALADDQCLGASVGFAARPSDTDVDKAGHLRRIRRAFMDHLAFVPDPAYSGAGILAVRSGIETPPDPVEPLPATPALDELAQWMRGRRG